MRHRLRIRHPLPGAATLLALFLAPLAHGQVDLAAQAVGAHTWTLQDGTKVQAGIESADGTEVVLRLPTGKTEAIKVARLGEDDRQRVAGWVANNAAPEGFGEPEQTIVITALKGNLQYDTASFEVYPGKKIKLVLRNLDDMPHNLVICKRSKDKGMSVAQEAWKLGGDGFAKHWIPEHPNLLFASRMADPHSTSTIHFQAPAEQGKYPFVCTLPGHAQIMNGTMVVTREINPLSELTFTVFEGSWEKLPDWASLKPIGTDHVPGGKFDLSCTKKSENFGIVFNGKLEAPAEGEYVFTLGSDDGSRLLIDGKVVIDHDGIHGTSNKSGKVGLSQGPHNIEVQYFERSGDEGLYVGWKPPGSKKEWSLSAAGKPAGGGEAGGQLLVAEDEARIYRNFIQGAGPRAIGVGYPGGLNLAYDANNMRLAMIWRGDFIDATRHWSGRGEGFQGPASQDLIAGVPGVPFGVLASSDQVWPTAFDRPDNQQQPPIEGGYVFKGYRLVGEARVPSFRYTFSGLEIEDTPEAVTVSASESPSLARTLTLRGATVANLHFRAAVAPEILPGGKGSYLLGGEVIMHLDTGSPEVTPLLRVSNGVSEVLVPVLFKDGTATIRQTISWK